MSSPPGFDRRVRRDERDRLGSGASRDGAQPLRASWDPTQARQPRDRPTVRPVRPGVRSRSWLGRFVASYGWRAYAIPVLVVLTVLTVLDVTRSGALRAAGTAPAGPVSASPPTDPVASPSDFGTLSTGTGGPTIIGVPPPADGTFDPTIATASLPNGGAFPVTGAGTWRVLPGSGPKVGTGTVSVSTYTVEVEDGMDTTLFGGDQAFASMVDQTLANPKSWTKDGRFALQRVDTGTPTFRISLSAQMTVRTDAECGYQIPVETSCYNSSTRRVALNVTRWVRGATAFQGDIGSYRQYMINHEVGHALGFWEHQPCASQAGLAPVMMQQSFGTANNEIASLDPQGTVPANGLSCRFNAWPFPRG